LNTSPQRPLDPAIGLPWTKCWISVMAFLPAAGFIYASS
jgi:hypothetical protein